MESINSQIDFGHRTADFFDDTSGDDESVAENMAPNIELISHRGSAAKKRQSGPTSGGMAPFASQCESKTPRTLTERDGYQRLSQPTELSQHLRYAESANSSFGGSVDELLPSQGMSPRAVSAKNHYSSPPQMPRQVHINDGEPLRSSTVLDRPESRQSRAQPSKVDQILSAHAIAHEITLQALMRDDNALDQSIGTFAPLRGNERASMLPTALRLNDPRSPRNQAFMGSAPTSEHEKKVHVVPPPIDTTAPRRSLPAHMVRTPYPFESSRRKIFEKSPGATPSVSTPALSSSEGVLTLSIRRNHSNSRSRVTTLTIPASNDFSAVRHSDNPSNKREQHLVERTDFDDEQFFRGLHAAYRELLGPLRFLAARSLSRIAVSGGATRAADAGYGWLHQPRSPRTLAYRGLSDTFSEARILQTYRKPALGRSRYAFVAWAHRLAAAPPVRTPQPTSAVGAGAGAETAREGAGAGIGRDAELVVRSEQPEGLEFVVSWSARRILLVLAMVLLASIAATLLWVLLGKSAVAPGGTGAGFRHAGDRVATGVVLGICVLLIGVSGIGAWLGVSWLVL